MKILLTVEFYEPRKGGAEEVVRQIAERLAAKGHAVTVATTAVSARTERIMNGVEIEEFAISGNSGWGIGGLKEEIARFEKLLLGNFDIVANYASQVWPTDLALPLLDRISAKKVFIPCGFQPDVPRYRAYYKEMAEYLRKYDAVSFASPTNPDKRWAAEQGIGEKAVIIPNGAAEEEFDVPAKYDIRSELGIRTPYLLIDVSNHYAAKGHGFVRAAFRAMKRKDATLLIIGEPFVSHGMRTAYHFLKDYARCWLASLLNSRVRLMRGTDREKVVSAYKSSDLFLFGSEVECAPLVMYESFAAKTPFITTLVGNTSDHSEYLKLVRTPREMAEAANKLLDHPEDRTLMAERAYVFWQEYHTWAKIADRYETLFSSLLAL